MQQTQHETRRGGRHASDTHDQQQQQQQQQQQLSTPPFFASSIVRKLLQTVDHTDGSFPSNVSDVFKGRWERPPHTVPSDSETLRGSEGDVGMRLAAEESHVLSEWDYITGDIVLRDGHYISDADWRYLVAGVYHNTTGTVYLMAHPPHLPPRPDLYPLNSTAAQDAFLTLRAERNLNGTTDDSSAADDRGDVPWPDLQSEQHKCVFTAVLQVAATTPSEALLSESSTDVGENEIPFRNLSMSGVMESSNCNTTLMITDLTSFEFNHLYRKAVNYAVMAIAVSFIQVMLLVRQVDFTSTQSSASRVSLLTVGMNANLDAYLCLIHLTVGMIMEPVFNVFAIISFLKFVAASIFSMRYMLNIWKARRPQSFADGWTGVRRELSSLYTRLYGAFLLGIVLMYQLSRLGPYILVPLYSFWIPQIYCTATRNAPKSLSPQYVIGMTLCRMPILLYFFMCPENIMNVRPAPILCLALVGWLLLQMCIVLLQHFLGPRFFIPKLFQPPKYNYKRPVPPSAIEEGEMNCVICLSPIESSSDHPTHMITPCNHVFHEECLQQWLEIRLECPTCRRVLPEY